MVIDFSQPGVTLGTITSFAAAYEHGATPIGLVFPGYPCPCCHPWPDADPAREPYHRPQGLIHALLTGISLSLVGFGYMAAVAFITPGLLLPCLSSR